MSEKEQYMQTLEREYQTTLKVLKAFPAAKTGFSPHSKCKSVKDLAYNFVFEESGARMAIDGALDFSKLPQPPASYPEIVSEFEKTHKAFVDAVKRTPDAELNKTVKFMSGPKKMDDWRRMDVLWFMLHDAIHHRGQLSVYLRMVDGKVPSIYGPSADEPWN